MTPQFAAQKNPIASKTSRQGTSGTCLDARAAFHAPFAIDQGKTFCIPYSDGLFDAGLDEQPIHNGKKVKLGASKTLDGLDDIVCL